MLSSQAAFAQARGDAGEIAPGDFLIDPPGLDAPAIRTPRLQTRVYADYTFASSPDLSALSVVEGSARNHRFALGAALRIRNAEVAVEIPFVQITKARFDEIQLLGFRRQLEGSEDISVARGDLRAGVSYSRALPGRPNLMLGAGLRTRLSTHTSRFDIQTAPPSGPPEPPVRYEFPRYFHIEPTVIFAAAFGPLSFVTNQGLLAMLGKDVAYQLDLGAGPTTVTQVFPELYFWDAHYALGMYFLDSFGFSLELGTVVQLNTVRDPPLPSPPYSDQLNDIVAVYLSPGVQIYLPAGTKLDVAGRIGLTDGADRFGVISFSGRYSLMVRVTRSFDFAVAR